jgi:hypothetical protein
MSPHYGPLLNPLPQPSNGIPSSQVLNKTPDPAPIFPNLDIAGAVLANDTQGVSPLELGNKNYKVTNFYEFYGKIENSIYNFLI